MVKTETIVKIYIYHLSFDEDINLEDYVRGIFANISNSKLRNYCNKNNIYYEINSGKEMLIEKIYRSCKSILSCKMLTKNRFENETAKEFYYRVYTNF